MHARKLAPSWQGNPLSSIDCVIVTTNGSSETVEGVGEWSSHSAIELHPTSSGVPLKKIPSKSPITITKAPEMMCDLGGIFTLEYMFLAEVGCGLVVEVGSGHLTSWHVVSKNSLNITQPIEDSWSYPNIQLLVFRSVITFLTNSFQSQVHNQIDPHSVALIIINYQLIS